MRSMTATRSAGCLLVLVLVTSVMGGCTTVKMTGTPRSGTEQLLLTGAWDTAICGVDFRPLAGAKVYLDAEYVVAIDKEWILSSIRRSMAEQGVRLEDDKKNAQVILEPSIGAYGTEERTCTMGLPSPGSLSSLLVPGGAALAAGSAASSSSTSLAISQTNQQDAVVKAALFAYDAKSGSLVWESGPLLNAEGVRDRFVFGTGPYRRSSLPAVKLYPEEAQARTGGLLK